MSLSNLQATFAFGGSQSSLYLSMLAAICLKDLLENQPLFYSKSIPAPPW
jgi:hypothetical protein